MNPKELRVAILNKLTHVIDPKTSVDVIRVRLIEDLVVDEKGHISYTFRSASPFCPIAVPLSNETRLAVAEVPGVMSQEIKVVGFALSDELVNWLRKAAVMFDSGEIESVNLAEMHKLLETLLPGCSGDCPQSI